MKVSRELGIYQKEGDGLIDNFIIDLSVNQLVEILNVDIEDDPNVYKEYDIDKKQYLILSKLVPGLLNYKFEDVAISYECYSLD